MKRFFCAMASFLLGYAVASANFCARDAVPAATLLFPYIVVDLDAAGAPDPAGYTTVTRITNAASQSVIVHFTVWDATGDPKFTFDEILSGYDALQINWRDVLNGRADLFDTSRADFSVSIPKTFTPWEWGPDGRSYCRDYCKPSAAGLPVAQNRSAVTASQCPGPPPYGNRSDLAGTIRGLLSGALAAYTHDACAGTERALRGDKTLFATGLIAAPIFFYATADVVTSCTSLLPSDPTYWSGVASTRNVLFGELIYLKPPSATNGGYSEMMPAVHVEAATSTTDGGPSVTGFYEERSGAETFREPLATAFAFSYDNDPAGAGVTSNLIVWKNFNELASRKMHVNDCGAYAYYTWDTDERSLSMTCCAITGIPVSLALDPNQFPFGTQKVPLTTAYFDLPGTCGWMLVVLPPSYEAGFQDPTPDGNGFLTRPSMGWGAVQHIYGTYSAGSEAITMANALCFPSQKLPDLAVNDGTASIR